MKSKLLITGAALLSATLITTQAQADDDDLVLWPLYGLGGLILLDAITDHHHHDHYYYSYPEHHYRYREHSHSYGYPTRHWDGGHDRDRYRYSPGKGGHDWHDGGHRGWKD